MKQSLNTRRLKRVYVYRQVKEPSILPVKEETKTYNNYK